MGRKRASPDLGSILGGMFAVSIFFCGTRFDPGSGQGTPTGDPSYFHPPSSCPSGGIKLVDEGDSEVRKSCWLVGLPQGMRYLDGTWVEFLLKVWKEGRGGTIGYTQMDMRANDSMNQALERRSNLRLSSAACGAVCPEGRQEECIVNPKYGGHICAIYMSSHVGSILSRLWSSPKCIVIPAPLSR